MKRLLFLILFCSFSIHSYAKIEAYFSPSTDCENQIVALINGTKHKLDIAIYSISNPILTHAIENAYWRGVHIRIVTDKEQAQQKYSSTSRLYKKGIPIKINTKYNIEHNKFAIFDQEKMVTGSYNWTLSATKVNSENCLVITRNKKLINTYHTHFEKLWNSYDAQQSKIFFEQ